MTGIVTRRLDVEHDGLDPYLVEEIDVASAKLLENIPLRWREAGITLPEMAWWVNELIEGSLARMRNGTPAIHTGRSLLLVGPVGRGKTHNAWGAVRALTQSGAVCGWRFLHAAEWFRNMEPNSGFTSAEVFRAAAEADVLVMDDIGACKTSSAREEALTLLVSQRNDWLRPTLFTTNVGAEKGDPGLSSYVGERVASRLAEMCGRPVLLTGPDRRRAGAR